MKKAIFFIAGLLFSSYANAQDGYNYFEFAMGTGADLSYVKATTNIPVEYNHFAFDVNVTYNYTPFVPIGAEVQFGTFSGGGLSPSQDSLGRDYVNHYKAFVIHADFQLGEAIDYKDSRILNIVKNFYFGTGVGLIANTITAQRYSIYNSTFKFAGSDNNIDFMVPLRLGYEIKIFDSYSQPSIAIDLGYTKNWVFGNGLSGYNDPTSKFVYNSTNSYRQWVLGFKYYFGRVVAYKKLIIKKN